MKTKEQLLAERDRLCDHVQRTDLTPDQRKRSENRISMINDMLIIIARAG